ncbi:MAG TPA: tripartite tricarboxylate transporter TctB family protein [Beijerinckiaceae bacterium]|jgi:putative tricarboxylic transport membrane protein
MRIELRDNAGFWSGLMLVGTGAAAIVIAADYRLGSALRMGPGYFPAALGGILIILGLVVLARGLKDRQPIVGRWSLRALVLLPLSLVLFGVLMEYAGFVPALLVLVVGSSAAGKEFNIVEALMLAVVLTVCAVGVFIWALGLPFPLVVGW